MQTIKETQLAGLTLLNRGKVRDVYSVSENELLLVATDRISAFDCIMASPIPGKGRLLTQLSAFWFERLSPILEHHLLTADFGIMPKMIRNYPELDGRSMLVKKTRVFPVECVVRGYLAGSGWNDYQKTGAICGHQLPEGILESSRLENPIFTPATKAATGHDENIPETEFIRIVGKEAAGRIKSLSMEIYQFASAYALEKGIIIADTKFEFGLDENGEILLIDEALTPDSSRFWDASAYSPGGPQASFDKQFLRDYLESADWDKSPPPPMLPDEIISATASRYFEAYRILTGRDTI